MNKGDDPIEIRSVEVNRGNCTSWSKPVSLSKPTKLPMWSANSALVGAGKPPLYCTTEDRPLSATRLMELTNKLLANLGRQGRPASPDLSITTAAANAVVLLYPCK